jgi:50S ribosomal subunit-associated GTPase HflX
VDRPAVSPEHLVPWLASTLQTADAVLLVVDLGDPACVERSEAMQAVLREWRVTLIHRWEPAGESARAAAPDDGDPFALQLPTLLLANKADCLANADAELEAFLEVTGLRYPALAVSATTGRGLGEIGSWLFSHLGIVRVYTKAPGRTPRQDRPFTLRRGQTVEEVARLVHEDLARSLKYARVWGKCVVDGHHVGREYLLTDGDMVELHG